jgi:hypothetical protein
MAYSRPVGGGNAARATLIASSHDKTSGGVLKRPVAQSVPALRRRPHMRATACGDQPQAAHNARKTLSGIGAGLGFAREICADLSVVGAFGRRMGHRFELATGMFFFARVAFCAPVR